MELPNERIITRADIAKWYGIGESGLRFRFKKCKVCITNRIFTKTDIQEIISKLGEPPFVPPNIIL